MAFKVNPSIISSIFDPFAQGDLAPFVEAIDPDVKWTVADPIRNALTAAGVFNREQWLTEIQGPLGKLLDLERGYEMKVDEVDIVGELKVILEASGKAWQKNGKPYNNRFAWFLFFSAETGKIIEIREYMNTALVQELVTQNTA